MGQSMEGIEEGLWINPDHHQRNVEHFAKVRREAEQALLPVNDTSRVWVIYSNHPFSHQAAAFFHKELAFRVHQFLEGSDYPVVMNVSEISVEVDKYKGQVLDGKRPFTVLMEDGEVFEVLGFASPDECDAASIDEVVVSHRETVTMSGTFWAWDYFYATRDGEMYWKEHIK